MKEVIVKSATEVNIIDSPIPTPNDDQVVIKVSTKPPLITPPST